MGMYDKVWINCLNCGAQVEFQSKAGPCNLNEYDIRDVPSTIAGDLDGEVEECHICNFKVQIYTQCIIQPMLKY